MKIASTIAKIVAALAFIAGIVYLVATYGDKIVAWAKSLLKCNCCEETAEEDFEEIAEEANEEAPVAEDKDFEG